MLKNKARVILFSLKNILRPAYNFLKDLTGFLSFRIFRFKISRFSDLKFFKTIIQTNLITENKKIPKIVPERDLEPSSKIKIGETNKKKPDAIRYSDIVSKYIITNFEKLCFMDSKDREFIKANLSSTQKEAIISEACNICEHKFDLLGSGSTMADHYLKAAGVEGFIYENRRGNDEIEFLKEEVRNGIKELLEIPIIQEVRELPGKEKMQSTQYTAQITDDFSSDFQPVDWHVDFKSGYRWSNKTWHKKIKYGHLPGVDIKVPWELSRSSHLVTLGQAYWITSDEKYCREYVCQIINWILDNPVSCGVNWACTMDVAIRACNWILALSFFKDSPLINSRFMCKLAKSLYLHGIHIEKNLEKGVLRVKGNHYVSDILGLLYIGLFFKFTVFGNRWVNFAVKELKSEIISQVYDDGSDFEASTYYHRLKTELFFYAMFFTVKSSGKFNGTNYIELGKEIFGREYVLKLKKMFEVILNLVDLKGSIIQVGDNDNGKLHIFAGNEIINMQYLITIMEIFNNGLNSVRNNTKVLKPAGLPDNFKIKEFDFNESALWLYGKYGKDIWDLLDGYSIKNLKSTAYKDSGWYICKCNDKKNGLFLSLNVLCGPNGQNNKGGHSHNDKLSFSLDINGEKIFVDPGTFLYTPLESLRNEFRSTFSHNTAVIDNYEQNRFISGNSFILSDDSKAKVNRIFEDDKYYFFSGEHSGYARLADPVIHKRQLIVKKDDTAVFIRDILENGLSDHEYFFNFILSPGLDFKIDDKRKGIVFYLPGGREFIFCPAAVSGVGFQILQANYSSSYGKRTKTNKLNYSISSSKTFEAFFVLSPVNKEYSFKSLADLFKMA